MTATTQAEATAVEPLELEPRTVQLPAVQQTGAVALADNSPAAIMLAAVKQGIPLDQIEKMMDLQDRYERREAEKAYNAAFAAFKAETVEIIKAKQVRYKNSKGGLTEYMHAELSDVLDAVTPHLSKHGLGISWRTTKQERNWVEVACTLRHTGGHSEAVTLGAAPDDSGGKNAIQAVGPAITYLERYTATAILGVAEKRQDDAGASTGGKDSDPVLDKWREVAMQGEAALRKHYDSNVPTEEFWREHGPSLRQAAKKADAEGGAR
ncbi:ERF family protein [Nostoc sp. NIES-2111]